MKKCEFFADTIVYLGHVIRPVHFKVAEDTTDAVAKFKSFTTQTELRSFLGMSIVSRHFVPEFSYLIAILRKN